ncbi:MAG: nicotinate-nucleotide--dimethylbenzimidazole phosphoribosyltransferase [Acidaminococcaceae bacterium]|nr:nicotinate-nucleotide--dimethylbenzimidazole phosphoribosyltransferase [Acidaminococcaceae bacterium]
MKKLTIKLPDEAVRQQVQQAWREKLQGASLGKLEDLVANYAAMVGGVPRLLKPVMLLMCGDHGIAKYGVSAFPQEVTLQMVNGYMRETAGANVLARHAGMDVVVVDVGTNFDLSPYKKVRQLKVARGTNDFTQGPAMTEEQAKQALQVGMDLADEMIDKGCNLLATGEMGIANTTSTAAIAAAFLGLDPEETVGRGSGINDERMAIKRQVVRDGLAKNTPLERDGFDILMKVGGYDHAGLAGMILGGARRGVPTMLDGVNATAAALLAYGIAPACAKYMLCSHLSSDVSHKKMLATLGLEPIVDAGMRLGEGTGASLAIGLLRLALGTYQDLE